MKVVGPLSLALVLGFSLAACSANPISLRCQRYDLASLTTDNDFTAVIPENVLPLLDAGPDHIIVSMSVLRPVEGHITLVQIIDGTEFGRWELELPSGNDIVVTCRIATSRQASTCGAILREQPHPPGGYYYLQPPSPQILEAGLSMYICN